MLISAASWFLPTYWKTFPGIYLYRFDRVYTGTAAENGIFTPESDLVNISHGKHEHIMMRVCTAKHIPAAAATLPELSCERLISMSSSFFTTKAKEAIMRIFPAILMYFFNCVSP
jgi:hypothetical protein